MFRYYYLLAIPAYKVVSNLYNYYRTRKLHNNYIAWLATNEHVDDLFQSQALFKSLLKKADVGELFIPTVQLSGYGRLAGFYAPVAIQFPSRLEYFALQTNKMFYEAEGVFLARAKETFNPLYWIDLAIFLPKHFMAYLGADPEKLLTKILQVVYFLAAGIWSLLLQLYPDIFRTLLEKLISQLH